MDDKELIVDKVVLINKDPYDERLETKTEVVYRLGLSDRLGCSETGTFFILFYLCIMNR
jgi:hypothetical protein